MNAEPWDLSCMDSADRIRRGLSLIPDLPLDRTTADKAVAIFDCLRLPDVVGTPTLREAGGDWFREIVAALMGAVDPVTGERHIRGLFLLAPKKSSKTTYGAALMLVGLIVNKRPRAELLLVAPTKLIADTCFSQALG
jgi:phage terminase large subunit-like protein